MVTVGGHFPPWLTYGCLWISHFTSLQLHLKPIESFDATIFKMFLRWNEWIRRMVTAVGEVFSYRRLKAGAILSEIGQNRRQSHSVKITTPSYLSCKHLHYWCEGFPRYHMWTIFCVGAVYFEVILEVLINLFLSYCEPPVAQKTGFSCCFLDDADNLLLVTMTDQAILP